MPYVPSFLQFALTDDEIRYDDKGNEILFRRRKLGDLSVTVPSICACDPLACPDTLPFAQSVPTGNFPVYISIAHIATDQRVGFAALIFSTGPVVRWEMAALPKQDSNKLKAGEIFGYGVDSGTGCFMDARSAELLLEGGEALSNNLIGQLDKTQVNTWSWAVMALSGNPSANFAAFSTGYGDGLYASYFGFGGDNIPVCLVTDFGLIYEGESEPQADPPKSRWMFWKK